MKKYKNIIYTTSEPLKNRGNFLDYLLETTGVIIVFSCTQGYSNERSYIEKYVNGVKKFKKKFPLITINNKAIIELTNSIYLGYTLWKYVPRNSIFIVDNPFFIFSTRIISLPKRLKVVFWIGDYFPNYKGSMKIYNLLVNYYNNVLDYVLYVSPPIQKIYLGRGNKKDLTGKHRELVSFGFNQSFKKSKKQKKIKLGFIGVLRKMQGLDLVFNFLSKESKSQISMDIIGQGRDLEHYKKLAKDMKLTKKVKFYGHVEKIDDIVANWDIGIALYENKENNYSIYCEPTKIKNYLSFGLPVITTDATYMQNEIIKFHAGEVINETVESLSQAVRKIMRGYKSYLVGVHKIGEKYEYKKWYDNAFKFIEAPY